MARPLRLMRARAEKSGRVVHRRPRRLVRLLIALVVADHAGLVAMAIPADDRQSFHRIGPGNGLPAAMVNCGMQDSRGFLWFGTGDGLTRFDGQQFKVFRPDPADPESLGNSIVLAIQEDTRGDLWIGTEGGVDVWRRTTERFAHFKNPLGDPSGSTGEPAMCVLRDPAGMFWVGTRRVGLTRLNPLDGRFESVGPAPGTPGGLDDGHVRCLFFDREGVLWIGTEKGGLARLDRSEARFDVFRHEPGNPASLPDDRVTALTEDDAGNLWVGTRRGVCRLDPARRHFERLQMDVAEMNEPPLASITTLLQDREGKLWIGTDGGGFTRYDPATHRLTYHRRSRYAGNSLLSDSVRMAIEDRDGDLWIGHFPSGISHFDRSAAAFQVFSSVAGAANTMADDQVLAFWEDVSGDLWVGTDNAGVNHWNDATGRWSVYTHVPGDPRSLGAKAAVCLLRDRRGQLWVGCWDGGLNRFEPETGDFTRFRAEPDNPRALNHEHVWQMVEDHDGQLWLGTIGGGVSRFVSDQEGFVHHRYDPADPRSLPDDTVCALLVTRSNELWAGTPKGLGRLDRATQRWDRFQSQPGEPGTLNAYWVFDLLEDREGAIWATTEGGGLNRVDPRTGRIEVFRTADGLPSDALRGILQDDDGVLWIGSNRGLVRFDPRTRHVRVFDETNGLPGSQFNAHARLRLRSGEFLFGTTQGFVRFDPRALTASSPPPPVRLTAFEVFNQEMRPGAPGSPLHRSITETTRLEIPARLSVIGFQFAAISFRSMERTRFRVKLEGFDEDWRDLGTEHRATFTNLDPGRYRLRVIAASAEGVWNEEGASLDLIVVPPWWRTWWFSGGVAVLLLGGAAWTGWAISTQRLRETQRQRELATERERVAERERAAEALRVLNQDLERRVTERTAELASAVEELEAFSYSVSHDLRAPLRAISGFSSILIEESAPKLDQEARRHLRLITEASARMGELIDGLLSLARVSRGEMQHEPLDLSALAAAVTEELRQAQSTPRGEFVITPDLRTTGDARLLRVVLVNLLGNALKFSGKREHPRIEFGATRRNGATAFFVRDNGAGFDMRYAEKLFAPFQRLHSQAEFPGTGLGLATVQRIIRRHGGQLSVESEPDRGATFYFTLPA